MGTAAPVNEILTIAVHAPSGDNSQPWYFRVDDSSIDIFNKTDADGTLYNFKQRGSYFAHGALIENINITARHFGYSAAVTAFPGQQRTARIALSPQTPETSQLFNAIRTRCTNRKPYSEQALQSDHKEALSKSVGEGALRFVEKAAAIARLASAISVNEEVLMENRQMHDFLFSMIRYSKKQERERPGLYIKTMEFPLLVQIMFRTLVRHWPLVRLLNVIGFSRSIPAQSMPVYRASSALAAIVSRGTSDTDYLNAGRAFQRVWLTATTLGLSVQPTTAIPYLMQRIEEGSSASLSIEHIDKIKSAYATIAEEFRLSNDERIAMLFRIGYDGEPSARSSKLQPEIVR